ncbi:MAG: NADH-quinone oxidoreductase subunit L [Proteobacteria bacterium]|nr:NADH-quinone oxidoreductase subunit L [Pseudomonadota bacterium]
MMSAALLRWVIFIPCLGFLLNALVFRKPSIKISAWIGVGSSFLSFILSLYLVSNLPKGMTLLDEVFVWISAGRIYVPFSLELNTLSSAMILIITGIGTLIHLYAASYMNHDESPWRFFAYLNLFLVAMLTLVLSSGLVGVFLGWEGVGLCSYLLIGYWYKEPQNSAAGMKAFITNRIGDLGFFIALFLVFAFFGTAEIRELIKVAVDPAFQNMGLPTWLWPAICISIFWACTGKSAQIPLYIWLPDAMAGPTPVSALIHAATMVTSGLFLITRLWPIFVNQEQVLQVIFFVGLATAWLAAIVALKQNDIKKVLAYSTVSQLGFMFVALGAASPEASFFHVITHACFKALLFLAAGSVIHGMHEEQDMLKMGGLRNKMPLTRIAFLVGTLAIIGFPFTSGFFSKDMILSKVFEHYGPVAFAALLGAALLTSYYMFRAYALTFAGSARTEKAEHAHESSWVMTTPLMVLALLSMFVGFLDVPAVLGTTHMVSDWVHGAWYGWSLTEAHAHPDVTLEWMLMGITSVLSLSVAAFSYRYFSKVKSSVAVLAGPLSKIVINKFYVDELYEIFILEPIKKSGQRVSRFIDRYILNGACHLGWTLVKVQGDVLSFFHTGNIQTYAWHFVFWLSLFLGVGLIWIL